jgi:hypothetical protein
MQRRNRVKQKQSLEERLVEQAKRLRAEALSLAPGAAQDAILRRAEQAELGLHMSQWLSSSKFKPDA